MKTITALMLVLLISLGATAQKYSAGMMFNPQGKVLLKEADKGSSLVMPLYALVTMEKGKFSYSPMFCLNDNSVGGFISYSFSKLCNTYIVGSKSTTNSDVYLGLGTGVLVSGGSNLFIEFGSLAAKWEPQIYLGVSIPFMWNFKNK